MTYRICVRGKYHSWCIPVKINPDDIQDYLEDGLDIIDTEEWDEVDIGLYKFWEWLKSKAPF
jgi:hypothetical protein